MLLNLKVLNVKLQNKRADYQRTTQTKSKPKGFE
tara:strand:- start:241 stop:342 length:102 start_codon:yes stop_codon:yes gene_type:complete